MSKLGSLERPLRVAIIGSGPSGFFAAESLLSSNIKVKIDVYDRLPTPFGLVRYGVAPDHPKIKNVIKTFEKTAAKDGFSFFGNVNIGHDVSVEDLRRFYDVLIFSCGAETDHKLGIPGENLKGSHTATEFVAWYNGHPDYRQRIFDLSQEAAMVIGLGNVAMDVCRILCKTVDELKNTDIAQHALDILADSKIKEIHIVGRRGPVQSAFTPVEIREFGELLDCDVILDPRYLDLNEASQQELNDPKNAIKKKNFEILQHYAVNKNRTKKKRFIMHYLKSPVELKGDGKLQKVVLEINKLAGDAEKQKAIGTGQLEEWPVGLLFRSVGYRGVPLSGVPFDEKRGIFFNQDGRIIQNNQAVPGLYAAGWIKRGPSGVIGTNKPDADETVRHVLNDIEKLIPYRDEGVQEWLIKKGVKFISFEDWKKIDAAEIDRGFKVGKPREKYVTIEDMLNVLNKT